MKEVTKVIKVPATLAEVNQQDPEYQNVTLVANEYERIDEFVQECGGEDKAVIVINRFRTRNAFQAAISRFNYQSDKIAHGDENAYSELVAGLPDVSRKYKFEVGEGGMSAKELKESVLSGRDKFLSMSDEEKAALPAAELLKMLGL